MQEQLGLDAFWIKPGGSIPWQDATVRRINWVLARITILSILFVLESTLGLALLGVEPLERN